MDVPNLPDPIGLAAVNPATPQSWNRYAYVVNNPLALVDPFGDDGCYQDWWENAACEGPWDGGPVGGAGGGGGGGFAGSGPSQGVGSGQGGYAGNWTNWGCMLMSFASAEDMFDTCTGTSAGGGAGGSGVGTHPGSLDSAWNEAGCYCLIMTALDF